MNTTRTLMHLVGWQPGHTVCGATGPMKAGRRGITCPWCRRAAKIRTRRRGAHKQQALLPWAPPPGREQGRRVDGQFAPLHVSIYDEKGVLAEVLKLSPAQATEVWKMRHANSTPEARALRVAGCPGCELFGLCALHGPPAVNDVTNNEGAST